MRLFEQTTHARNKGAGHISETKRRCEDMYSCFHLVMLILLLSLVEVNSQSFPHLSFMSLVLANHSYVDISQVGRPDIVDGGEGVQCITDLTKCCTSTDDSHRADWYFPNGTKLHFAASTVDIF